jgi:hypothetical protein
MTRASKAPKAQGKAGKTQCFSEFVVYKGADYLLSFTRGEHEREKNALVVYRGTLKDELSALAALGLGEKVWGYRFLPATNDKGEKSTTRTWIKGETPTILRIVTTSPLTPDDCSMIIREHAHGTPCRVFTPEKPLCRKKS